MFAAIYVNGKLKASKSFDEDFYKVSDILGGSCIFNIGKATWGGGEYYGGYIDNVTVYNYALNSEEVKEEYDEFVSGINSSAPDATESLDRGYVSDDFKVP